MGIVAAMLILSALLVFAIAQPVLDLLGRHPEFFVAREARPFDPVWLAVSLSVLIPLLCCLTWAVFRLLGRKVGGAFLYLLLALVLSVITLQIIKSIEQVPGYLLVFIALLVGIICSWLIHRSGFIRRFIGLCAIAVFVVPVNFLFFTDVNRVVFPEPEKTENTGTAPLKDLPVIMIVFDALPLKSLLDENLQIDQQLFPGFAELADRSTWYRNATTVSFETLTAVPAALSGMLPDAKRLPTLSDYPQNLFTLLAPSYQFYAQEPYTQLCPEKLCEDVRARPSFSKRMRALFNDVAIVYLHLVLPVDIANELPSITTDWKYFAAKDAVGVTRKGSGKPEKGPRASKSRFKVAALERENFAELFEFNLRVMEPREEGALYFQHLLLPHIPWRYLPSGKQYLKSHDLGIERTGKWVGNKRLVKSEYHRHLLQLIFVDSLVQKLLRRLDQTSMFEQAMIVITADHGASFRPGEYKRRAGVTNLLDIASVPLFIKYPEQAGGEISELLAQTIDVLPTVADTVGADLPGAVDGQSLVAEPIKQRKRVKVFHLPRGFEFEQAQIAGRELDPDLLMVKAQMRDDLYKLGAYRKLVGISEPIKAVKADHLEVTIVNGTAYEHVDREDPFLPTRVMGSIKGLDNAKSLPIAIGVNGRIAGTAETYSDDNGDIHFSTMLSPDSFQNGTNRLRIYLIENPESGKSRLVLIPAKGEVSYRLLTSSDGTVEIEQGSRRYKVTPTSRKNPVRGYVDNAVRGHQITSITGWGADSRPGGEPVQILLFDDKKLVASTRTNSVRVDVAKAFALPRLKYAGFGFHIPSVLLSEPGQGSLRLFIITSDGIATELVYDKNYPWK